VEKNIFREKLLIALKERYGRLPTSKTLARDLFVNFKQTHALSDESVRKWITGKSIPRGHHLACLSILLKKDVSYWFTK
jgi:hypothetical protein